MGNTLEQACKSVNESVKKFHEDLAKLRSTREALENISKVVRSTALSLEEFSKQNNR